MEDTTLFGRHTATLMQRLYTMLGTACNTVGDMSLVEYAVLLDASEPEGGMPVRRIEQHFDVFKNPQHFVTLLEDKELTRRVRDRGDRRAFALQVTDKGLGRIRLVDETLAVAAIDANEHLAQDEFEHLLGMLHALAREDGAFRGQTLLPAQAVISLCRYHRLFAQCSSVLGLPPLLMGVLCVLSVAGAADEAYLSECLCSPLAVMRFQLRHMVERGLAAGETDFSLTDEGAARVQALLDSLEPRLQEELARMEPARAARLRDVAETAVYLFR